jgi:phosphatidylserine/phosphatidylglycerophosphate/cardiolipin synthase-like enzyme
VTAFLSGLGPSQLGAIAGALERSAGERLDSRALAGLGLEVNLQSVTATLQAKVDAIGIRALAALVRAVADERQHAMLTSDRRLELVWTGPERDNSATRETSVVVRELFRSADREVLVAGYALFNARSILDPLADRMAERPDLRVRLVVNVARTDGREIESTLNEFVRQFRTHHWPPVRLPELYYDPRSFEPDPSRRAVMHAKCVLVDDCRTFISSANLTEAAQVRNIELGIVVNDAVWARCVREQFDSLIEKRYLRRLVA